MNVFTRLAMSVVALALLTLGPIGTAWAQVKVTSAEPAETFQGTVSLDVTVNGSGFDNSATARFLVTGTTDTGGVTVKKVVFKNSKQLVATIEVADTAVVNKFDIEVTLSTGRKGKGTTLFTVLKKAVTALDPCIGATAAFVLSKQPTTSTPIDVYLANESATCQRYLLSLSNGYYNRYSSFRVVVRNGIQVGRVVTTDGLSNLLLISFPIGADMQVDPASVVIQRIFDPAQLGFIDVNSFDLAADGRRLAYITMDEDGGTTYLARLRFIDDVDACVPPTPGALACRYDVGPLLAEHVGLTYVLGAPRWSTDGSWIYFENNLGVVGSAIGSPYISRVSLSQPLQPGQEPEIVMSGVALRLFELRMRGSDEVMAYGENSGTGCHEVRVVPTTSCRNGVCSDQINSTSPRVLVVGFASIQSIDSTSMTLLTDSGAESRRGKCTRTGQIVRAVDSVAAGVKLTTVTTGSGPAAK